MGSIELPNILIVLLDDVGVDQVSPYGFPGAPPTPVIAALAEEGLRFDQAWATPVCSPSRAALMTGQLAYRNLVGAVLHAKTKHELPLQAVTLPEMLDLSGTDWSSAAVGKWHLATSSSEHSWRHPSLQGFDWFAGALNNIDVPPTIEPRTDRSYINWERADFDGTVRVESTFATTKTADDAISALAQMPSPWVLYVAFQAAHRPLMIPPTLASDIDPLDEGALYASNITAADLELGRVLDALGPARDSTLIFVIGDNGTPAYGKDADGQEGAKGSLTEGGIRVPFIVSGPGVTTGAHSDALVHVVDVFPTLMEIAGIRKIAGVDLDGLSLVPLFQAPDELIRTRLYTEMRLPSNGPPWRKVSAAARDDSLKVVNDEGVTSIYRINGFTEHKVKEAALSTDEQRRVRKLDKEISRHL